MDDVVEKNVAKLCATARSMKQKRALSAAVMVLVLVLIQETLHNSPKLVVQNGPIVQDEDKIEAVVVSRRCT